MKVSVYLKDQATGIFIYLAGWIMILIFFMAFHTKNYQIVTVSTIYFLTILVQNLWSFLRKQHFYTNLISNSEKLDKKYLLSEMMEEPDFYEGKLVDEVLRSSHKSMVEQVTISRHNFSKFRDYIELWVHEIKLPLTSLLLMCHNETSISDTPAHPLSNQTQTDKYITQLNRINEYIENVLYYARCENAEKDYIIKEVSLKRAFANTALKYRDELLGRDVTIQTDGLEQFVMTDGKWLEYILGQLFGNSLKYFSDTRAPEISVYTREESDKISLHFQDNGIGISASDLPYIFEKSFTGTNGRISHAETHTKSTGFGLYIVKNLCHRLGHTISATSVQGEYTDICISFGKNDFYQIKS